MKTLVGDDGPAGRRWLRGERLLRDAADRVTAGVEHAQLAARSVRERDPLRELGRILGDAAGPDDAIGSGAAGRFADEGEQSEHGQDPRARHEP